MTNVFVTNKNIKNEVGTKGGKHESTEFRNLKNVLLSVRGVFKTFGLNTVLKGIDLDVGKGEVLALIGGNGAGKSTLMKIIMGIYQPDEGRTGHRR